MEYHSANNSIVVQFREKENTYRKEKINAERQSSSPCTCISNYQQSTHRIIGHLLHRQLHFVFFWKEATLRIWTKTFFSTTQLLLSVLTQWQKQKHSLQKVCAEHQYMFWWVHRSEHHLQRVEFENSAEHTALKCGKWYVLSWCARTGKRLTSCIKIHLKMKPALGNLFALSMPIVEKNCFLMKFFCKQRFSYRANSICCSLVRTEGWRRGEAGCAKWMGLIAFIYKKTKWNLCK